MTTDAADALRARMILITQGPLPRVMWRLVYPSAIWYLLNYAFFVVDTYFVGRLGTTQLAAMSLICAVVALTMTVAQGLGSALSAIASIYLGAKLHREAVRLVTHTVLLGIAVSFLVGGLGLATIDGVFVTFGATREQLPFIHQYMPIWYFGYVFVALSTVAQSAIRSTGDVTTPLVVLLFVGVLNVVLDKLLIVGFGATPGLGMRGAAYAAVISRAVGAAIALGIVARRDRLIVLREIGSPRASWAMIGRIAGPVVAQMTTMALSSACMLRIASRLGSEVVAGLGVGFRIDAIASALVLGLPIVLPTFIGQNAGAGNLLRAGEGIATGTRQVVVAQGLIAAALALLARGIAVAFSHDLRIASTIQAFVLLVPIGHLGFALLSSTAGTLISLGRMRSYVIVGITPSLFVVALAWLGASMFGVVGLLAAYPLGRAIAGLWAWVWIKGVLRSAGYLAPLSAPQPA